jgi:hypothetical protein
VVVIAKVTVTCGVIQYSDGGLVFWMFLCQ